MHTMSQRQIVVAGLSPAWQQILVLDGFHVGEVNRAREVHWCASGKVLNVGIALSQLSTGGDAGIGSRVLSVIGPRTMQMIQPELTALGADCRWIETRAETRICTTIVDQSAHSTTELVENAPLLFADELAKFREAFAQEAAAADVVVLTGSLPHVAAPLRSKIRCGEDASVSLGETHPRDTTHPRGATQPPDDIDFQETTFYRELLKTTSARAVLDVRGPELLAALECRPFCVKPNREELGKTLGRALNSDSELHSAMRSLHEQGAQWVLITEGAGLVWLLGEGAMYALQPPRIERVINPIASGDCLAAGIAWALASGRSMPDAVRFGIAAAADNVGQILPARLNMQRIAELEILVALQKF
jgi:fructose-1-phosphate kinase PfkB-like protein